MPDRIAFYSYAHVPWIKGNGQRGYSEEHLPSAEIKRKQYQLGKELLEEVVIPLHNILCIIYEVELLLLIKLLKLMSH